MNTVFELFKILKLQPYTHVSVRKYGKNGVEYLGGGTPAIVNTRFGQMEILESNIFENCLCIYVR